MTGPGAFYMATPPISSKVSFQESTRPFKSRCSFAALVMSAAQSVMPELIGGCVPLPTPGREARKKFKKLGLEWDDKGAMNRTYAVFTPYPYRGGCEVCHSCDTCPSSQAREIGRMEE